MPARKTTKKVTMKKAEVPPGRYTLVDDAEWGGFINIRLSDEHSESFFAWFAENAQYVGAMLDDLLGEGMRVGVSYDREHECYITTFTGRLVQENDERYVMTTRAGTLAEVEALSVWKHVVLAQGEYGDFRPKSGTFDRWG